MSNIYGITAYQQSNQVYNQETKKNENAKKTQNADKTQSKNNTTSTDSTANDTQIKNSTWKPIDKSSSLVPSHTDGIGTTIGDVKLSDKAKDYYSKLKAKFGNMDFIAVSQDMKAQVKSNAAAYGNADKQVVLIDDAKIEQMANDEVFQKKYEGIIAMSQVQLASAKTSLSSSGASVKSFGMSVEKDGSTNFFASVLKPSKEETKRLEKKQAEKKATKAKEKKQAEKKAWKEKLEKIREEKTDQNKKTEDDNSAINDNEEYINIEAGSIDDLVNQVSKYAYENSSKSVLAENEKYIGQHFDSKW